MRGFTWWGGLAAVLLASLAISCGRAPSGTGSEGASGTPVDPGSSQPAPAPEPDGQTPCTPLLEPGMPGAWEQIGESLGASTAALALDACGNPTVAIQQDPAAAFRVVRWNGSSWQQLGDAVSTTPAGAAQDRAQYGSLAVDGRDNAVLAWVQVHAATVYGQNDSYAAFASRWNGKHWSAAAQLADWTRLVFRPSVVMDAAGVTTVAWTEESAGGQGAARAARWNGASWMAIPDVPGVPPIALDSSGGLLTTKTSAANLSVLRWDGLRWASVSDSLASTPFYYGPSATWLGVDSSGQIIATYDTDAGAKVTRAHVAVWDGARWRDLPDPSSTWSSGVGIGVRAGEIILQVREFDWARGIQGEAAIRSFDGSSWRTFAPLPPHDGALYGVSGAIAPDGSLVVASGAPVGGKTGPFVFRWR